MKTNSFASVVFLSAVFLAASGCRTANRSPKIVCAVGGVNKPTGFTFAGFADTLRAEHGFVEVREYEHLKTPKVEIYFRKLDDRTVLAEKVVLSRTQATMDPPLFFGLAEK